LHGVHQPSVVVASLAKCDGEVPAAAAARSWYLTGERPTSIVESLSSGWEPADRDVASPSTTTTLTLCRVELWLAGVRKSSEPWLYD